MAWNTPKLDKAVEDFKKLCDPHWQLYRYGQYYVTNRTIDDLFAQIEANLNANIRFKLFPDPPRGQLLQRADLQILKNAEVPREDVLARRLPSVTRRANGADVRWTTRRVAIGGGEGASGWAFDSSFPRGEGLFDFGFRIHMLNFAGFPARNQESQRILAGDFARPEGSSRARATGGEP